MEKCKDDLCYTAVKRLARLSPVETQKTENAANKLLDLATVISKLNVGSPRRLILAARDKVLPERERNKSRNSSLQEEFRRNRKSRTCLCWKTKLFYVSS